MVHATQEDVPDTSVASVPRLIAAFVLGCFLFAAVGAAMVTFIESRSPNSNADMMFRSAAKAGAFALAATALAAVLARGRKQPTPRPIPSPGRPGGWGWVALPLVVAVLLGFPRLAQYPGVAPDEMHHLIVARNLAERGAYASGHPDGGLIYFDSYDSVGAPVIMPVAAAFRLWGVSFRSARLVMAAYYLALVLAAFGFALPVFGGRAAACSALLVALAWGSIYLGRTLYGEVPALTFMLAGLAAWRAALRHEQDYSRGLLAGVLFGLAILSKSIILISVFVFAALWLYDWVTERRIGWRHVCAPGAGVVLVLAAWILYQHVHQPDSGSETRSLLDMYRHYLIFGVRSALGNVNPMLRRWFLPLAAGLWGLGLCLRRFGREHYDPATISLAFFGGFYLFWWLFFTPGQLPRYGWYGLAVAGFFAGPLVWHAVSNWLPRKRLVLAAAALTMVLLPTLWLTGVQIRRTWTLDETAPAHAIADYLAEAPRGERVATTDYQLARLFIFANDRYVPHVAPDEPDPQRFDRIIVNLETDRPTFIDTLRLANRVGNYGVFRAERP